MSSSSSKGGKSMVYCGWRNRSRCCGAAREPDASCMSRAGAGSKPGETAVIHNHPELRAARIETDLATGDDLYLSAPRAPALLDPIRSGRTSRAGTSGPDANRIVITTRKAPTRSSAPGYRAAVTSPVRPHHDRKGLAAVIGSVRSTPERPPMQGLATALAGRRRTRHRRPRAPTARFCHASSARPTCNRESGVTSSAHRSTGHT